MKIGKDIATTTPTTPEMIGHYREFLSKKHWVADWLEERDIFGSLLFADPDVQPFILHFRGLEALDWEVAYLSVVDGRAEWRHSERDPGYLRCPVVTDRELLAELDGVFGRYYAKRGLPTALKNLKESLGPWDRVAWTSTHFFGGKPVTSGQGLFDDGVIANLYSWEGPRAFLEEIANALHKDGCRLSHGWAGPGKKGKRILAAAFDTNVYYVDVATPGNLYLQLLLGLNQVLWPHYELRRYRNDDTGNGGILLPMSVCDWETLEIRHGKDGVAEIFEKITDRTLVDIHTDERGYDLETY